MEKITQKERLMIAAQQMAGMQSPGYPANDATALKLAEVAFMCADTLIWKSGCELEPVSAEPESVNDSNGH